MTRKRWTGGRVGASLAAFALGLAPGCGGSGMGESVRQDITAQMGRAQKPLSDCYKAALEGDRKMAGRVVVKFDAAAGTGQFSNVRVVSSELGDDSMDACVVEQVSALKLEAPQKTVVSVEYPVDFTPAEASPP